MDIPNTFSLILNQHHTNRYCGVCDIWRKLWYNRLSWITSIYWLMPLRMYLSLIISHKYIFVTRAFGYKYIYILSNLYDMTLWSMVMSNGVTKAYLNTSISVRFSDTDISISLYDGSLGSTQRCKIVNFVIHILDRERDNLDTHTAYVRGSNFAYFLSKFIPVLKDFFHCKST